MTSYFDSLKAKHNPTDWKAYRDFQAEQEAKYEKITRKRLSLERLQSALHEMDEWDRKVPAKWRGLRINDPEALNTSTLQSSIKKNGYGSFYLHGSTVETTNDSFRIARRFISSGRAKASQVKWLTESAFLTADADKLKKIFTTRNKVILILKADGGEYSERETRLWRRVMDFAYFHDVKLIINSKKPFVSFSEIFMNHDEDLIGELFGKRIIEIQDTIED